MNLLAEKDDKVFIKDLIKLSLIFWLGLNCHLFLVVIASADKKNFLEDLNSVTGIVYRDSFNNLKLDIPVPNLKKGTKITIITLSPQYVICCAEVIGISSSRQKPQIIFDFDKGTSATYDLRLEGNYDFSFGFGIVNERFKFTEKSGSVITDLNGDGIPEYFRSCTSTEGIHFTVWSGRPLKGKRLWHAYFYLEYDLEPTCVEEDFGNKE